MELLAFSHAASAHEDPRPEPKLRALDDLELQLPSSAWMGIAGMAVAASVMAQAPEAKAVVGPGDVCSAVGDVQQALLDQGFNPGPVDEVFGIGTTDAVRSFQRFEGLSVDGVVGPATADALGLGDAENPDSPFLVGNGCGGTTGGGSGVVVASASGVNIREAPGFTRIIGYAGEGESLSLTSQRVTAAGYVWAKLEGEPGWVAEEFLSFGDDDGSGGIGGGYEGPAFVSTASGGGVNVRTSPDGPRAYGLPDGAGVTLTGVYSTLGGFEWARISDGNWIATDFLSTGGSGDDGSTGGGSIFFGPSGARVVSTLSGFGVNVRDTPDGAFQYGLDDGASVFLTGRYSFAGGFQWAEISGGGWIATDFLL